MLTDKNADPRSDSETRAPLAVTRMEEPADSSSSSINNIASSVSSSVKEVAQKTGEAFTKATESISKAIESALAARDHVVMVRVNDDAIKKLDALVQSGIFKSRSESAAFLISEGIKAQEPLFDRISEKIEEIERLRSELKSIVHPEEENL